MEFTESNIILNSNENTKENILRKISKYSKKIGIATDDSQLFNDFMKREEEGVTGLQEEFGIPHAKSDFVSKATVIYLRNKSNIKDWETLDEGGVKHVFALLVPKNEEGTNHIKMLSQLAVGLMDDDFKERIKESNSEKELANLIKKQMNGDGNL